MPVAKTEEEKNKVFKFLKKVSIQNLHKIQIGAKLNAIGVRTLYM